MSKILIIDDSPTVLKIMSTSLFAQGYIVKTAVSGAEGLQAAREERPQAIVLDINLPDINGLEVLKKLKEHPELKDVPVLLLTGQDDAEHAQKGMELGACGFLGKYATTPKVLGGKVKEALAACEVMLPPPNPDA